MFVLLIAILTSLKRKIIFAPSSTHELMVNSFMERRKVKHILKIKIALNIRSVCIDLYYMKENYFASHYHNAAHCDTFVSFDAMDALMHMQYIFQQVFDCCNHVINRD